MCTKERTKDNGGREQSDYIERRGEPTASSGASMLWPKSGSERGGGRGQSPDLMQVKIPNSSHTLS